MLTAQGGALQDALLALLATHSPGALGHASSLPENHLPHLNGRLGIRTVRRGRDWK